MYLPMQCKCTLSKNSHEFPILIYSLLDLISIDVKFWYAADLMAVGFCHEYIIKHYNLSILDLSYLLQNDAVYTLNHCGVVEVI